MTVRWPWQKRLDTKRKREADAAERKAARLVRDRVLEGLDPATLCECGHPLNAHPRKVSGFVGLLPRSCGAMITRRHPNGDDAWPCGCRDFRQAPDAA